MNDYHIAIYDLLQEEFEDTKGVIRIRKSKKNREHNDQRKKDKQQSTKHNTESKTKWQREPM